MTGAERVHALLDAERAYPYKHGLLANAADAIAHDLDAGAAAIARVAELEAEREERMALDSDVIACAFITSEVSLRYRAAALGILDARCFGRRELDYASEIGEDRGFEQ